MVDINASDFKGERKTVNAKPIGNLGMALLGCSFILWALLIMSLAFGTSTDSSIFIFLDFTSMGSPSLGIILVNADLSRMLQKRRLIIRISTLIFVVINAVGLSLNYYLLHGGHGGIDIRGPVPEFLYIYILGEVAVYSFYVFVYDSYLYQFLNRFKMWIAVLCNGLAGVYLILMMTRTYQELLIQATNHVPGTVIVGLNNAFIGSVQLTNPLFGLPGVALNETSNFIGNVWMDTIIIIANVLFAYLFVSTAFRADREKIIETKGDNFPSHSDKY